MYQEEVIYDDSPFAEYFNCKNKIIIYLFFYKYIYKYFIIFYLFN